MSVTGSLYLAAHPDYVRCVRILPIDAENTELHVDWLVSPNQDLAGKDKFENTFALSELVLEQDQVVCELNQKGLKNTPHTAGVLVPQEYELWDFHEWLRRRLEPDR